MIDLHLHSTHSDGTMSPTELIQKAAEIGLEAISITDHDTVSGTEEALRVGKDCGVIAIPGLEISARFEDLDLHLLGYCFNWKDPLLLKALGDLQHARNKRNKQIIEKLRELGIDIGERDLINESKIGSAGRPHFARLLVKKKVVKSYEQAFNNYLKVGRCAYVPRYVLEVSEAIHILHKAGGLAVLAHPVQLRLSSGRLDKTISKLKMNGLDGLETYYPTQKGKLRNVMRNLASRHQLLETGGSDYHGSVRPGTSMAGATQKFYVPGELLDQLTK